MMKLLALPCDEFPKDTLQIEATTSGNQLRVEAVCAGVAPIVFIDREKARQLFNWLGVWLHKHGGDGS